MTIPRTGTNGTPGALNPTGLKRNVEETTTVKICCSVASQNDVLSVGNKSFHLPQWRAQVPGLREVGQGYRVADDCQRADEQDGQSASARHRLLGNDQHDVEDANEGEQGQEDVHDHPAAVLGTHSAPLIWVFAIGQCQHTLDETHLFVGPHHRPDGVVIVGWYFVVLVFPGMLEKESWWTGRCEAVNRCFLQFSDTRKL